MAKKHSLAISCLICIVLFTLIAAFINTTEEVISWRHENTNKPYDALIFNTTADIEVTQDIAKKIQNAKPGDIVYISVKELDLGGPTCAGQTHCDTWELHLRKCNRLNLEDSIEWTPENEALFGIDPQCIPALLVPTKMATGEINVVDCSPNGYTLNGFFTIHYQRGHFGQLFYRAYAAIPSPERVSATLTQYGTNTCWP
ncbi:hypothetical protein [Shewanella youngdeokensis]|uniref:Uncharacterized protein n=1 Tax=Shewanella youngdeokensis TaxID=2999068 RepID=A0ABZ0JUZ5_9GAMM|nr:hypothetical protein RGE70_09405 [Shewanella sp. DAU334]